MIEGGMSETEPKTIEQRLEAIEKTMEESEVLLRAVYAHTKKTQRFILWGRMMSLVYLILIVAPLIFAAVYLPSLLRQYAGTYQELLDPKGNASGGGGVLHSLQQELELFNTSQ